MIRSAVLLAAAALVCAPAAANAELPVNGIAVGSSVAAAAQTLGMPDRVASLDTGQRFEFPGGCAAYADDDGVVLAVEARIGSPAIDIEGDVHRFPIGRYTAARADAELADVAEFAAPGLRSYRLAPRRDLVLAFDAASNRLQRVVYGEPGQLARLGLLAGDAATKAVIYRAPQPRSPDSRDAAEGPYMAVYRVGIDRSGSVSATDVAIPSRKPAGDHALEPLLRRDRYVPATLDGRPIASTVFVVRHHG